MSSDHVPQEGENPFQPDEEHRGHGCPRDPEAGEILMLLQMAMRLTVDRLKVAHDTPDHIGDFMVMPRFSDRKEVAAVALAGAVRFMCNDINQQAMADDGPYDIEQALESAMISGMFLGGVITEMMVSDFAALGQLTFQQDS